MPRVEAASLPAVPRAVSRTALLAAVPPAAAALAVAGALAVPVGAAAQGTDPLPACEWCGTGEAPDSLGWRVTIAGEDEPGQRIRIRGVVYQPDGETPAPDVILYLYHTNADGIYAKLGDESGNGRRHGHLRGWLRTDDRGRYEIRTIRPGNYPGRDAEQHIHVTVQEPDGTPEYWIPSFNFAGDPHLDADPAAPHVVTLERGPDGVWLGQRDIVLPTEPAR